MENQQGQSGQDEQYELIGVFPNRAAADLALAELKDAGFDMSRLGAVIRDERTWPRPGDQMASGGADAALNQIDQVVENTPEERVQVIVVPQGRDTEAVVIMKRNGAQDISVNRGGLRVNSENDPINRDAQPTDEVVDEVDVVGVNVDTPYVPPQTEQPAASSGMAGAGVGTDTSPSGLTGAVANADNMTSAQNTSGTGLVGASVGGDTSAAGLTGPMSSAPATRDYNIGASGIAGTNTPPSASSTGVSGAGVGADSSATGLAGMGAATDSSVTGLANGSTINSMDAADLAQGGQRTQGDARDASDANPAN